MTRFQRKWQRGEHGTSIVEFSMVFLLICVLFFALIEVSMLVYDELGVSRMAKDGARAASAAGSGPDADFKILQAINGASVLSKTKINKVIVYWANPSAPDTVPSGCLSASVPSAWSLSGVAGQCNVYGSYAVDHINDANILATHFGCKVSGVDVSDADLCPTVANYNNCLPTTMQTLTSSNLVGGVQAGRCDVWGYSATTSQASESATIGVRVEYAHSSVTGLFQSFGSFTISQTAFAPIEASRYENS